jgi:hypothetical protein
MQHAGDGRVVMPVRAGRADRRLQADERRRVIIDHCDPGHAVFVPDLARRDVGARLQAARMADVTKFTRRVTGHRMESAKRRYPVATASSQDSGRGIFVS